MAYTARSVEYFYTTINSKVDEAYDLLDTLAGLGVSFVAMTAIPIGPQSTQLTLFPENADRLQAVARQTGLVISGPHQAVLVQGDDEIGALARIHHRIREANVDVFASSGITDGKGRYGYILYVRPPDADRAIQALAK